MRDHVLMYLNGRRLEVRGDDAFLTLAEFVRRRHRLTGTKIVCAEGDCGSCAALVGRPDSTGSMRYAAVTSCIQLVFQLDAAHVVTIEGLRQGRDLNPIQQAMVTCQGSQCGFCTPGIVVALYDLMHDGKPVDARAARRGLVGNLCRCTGYDSILRAALETDRAALQPLDALYPPAPLAADLSRAAGDEMLIETPTGRRCYKPATIANATRFRADHPDCAVVAGATDLAVPHNKGTREIRTALSLGGLADLRAVHVAPDAITLGAAASLTTLETIANDHLPELGRFMAYFGSPLIKNAGTLGGNLVTGSPIGDTLPALIALDATVHVAGISGTRTVPVSQFYRGYRTTVLAPDELVTAIHIPVPPPDVTFKLYKISRRKDLDISTFGCAIWLRLASGIVEDVRLTFGGVGPTILRLPRTEALLRGHAPTPDRFEAAAETARHEVTPITDVRGSADYRRTLAANILLKFWHETIGNGGGGDHDPSSNGNGSPDAHRVTTRTYAPALNRSPEGGR